MSGAEILGVVAGVFQIADLGGKVSVKLFAFSKKVKDADRSIDIISKDIASTGAVLQQLGYELAKDKSGQASLCSKQLVESAEVLIQECRKIFANIDKAIDGNSGNKVILGFKQKLKYTYFEPQIELLRTNLERLKSSLAVMLNVLIYAEQIRTRQTSVVLRQQEELIQILGRETAKNESKLQDLLKTLNLEQDKDSEDHSPNQMGTISTQTTLTNAGLEELPDGLFPSIQASAACPGADSPVAHRPVPNYNAAFHTSPAVGVNLSNGRFSAASVMAPHVTAPGLHIIEQYVALVAEMLTAIHSTRYELKLDMRERLQIGIFEVHWQEWYPLHNTYGLGTVMRHVTRLPELANYWAMKYDKENRESGGGFTGGRSGVAGGQGSLKTGVTKRKPERRLVEEKLVEEHIKDEGKAASDLSLRQQREEESTKKEKTEMEEQEREQYDNGLWHDQGGRKWPERVRAHIEAGGLPSSAQPIHQQDSFQQLFSASIDEGVDESAKIVKQADLIPASSTMGGNENNVSKRSSYPGSERESRLPSRRRSESALISNTSKEAEVVRLGTRREKVPQSRLNSSFSLQGPRESFMGYNSSEPRPQRRPVAHDQTNRSYGDTRHSFRDERSGRRIIAQSHRPISALPENVNTHIVQKRLGADLNLAALDVNGLVLRWTTLSQKDVEKDMPV